MRPYSLAHLSDTTLLRDLKTLVARDRATTAAMLAHIAEVDTRRLYAPAGHSSMFGYCVEELRLSEDAAYKRITAARAARKFPALFECVADGRLHLTAIRYLAPHLTAENLVELLAASVGKRSSEVESMLALRFGNPAPPTRIRAVADPVTPAAVPSPGGPEVGSVAPLFTQLVSRPVDAPLEEAPSTVSAAVTSTVQASPSPAPAPVIKYRLEVTIDETTHAKLRRAQGLLGHTLPSGDVASILDRALDALLAQVERRRIAATPRPRTAPAPDGRPRAFVRRIPAAVRRAVWERDRGVCTFVGENGHRCRGRGFLELDHVTPLARGGLATIANLRLRCRTHNQLEAERAFGTSFMSAKRGDAASEPEFDPAPVTTSREATPRAHDPAT